MTQLPVAGKFNNEDGITETAHRNALEDFLSSVREMPGGQSQPAALPTASTITPVVAQHTLNGNGTVNTISTANMTGGRRLLLRPQGASAITFTHSSNIVLQGSEDFLMNNSSQSIELIANATDTWIEIRRSGREDTWVAGISPAPSFGTNWAGGGYAMRWFKDTDGVVHVFGYAQNTIDPDTSDLVIQFAAGYRPPQSQVVVVAEGAVGTVAQGIRVGSNGEVRFDRFSGTPDASVILNMVFSFPTFL
jgi:hypothetical protein